VKGLFVVIVALMLIFVVLTLVMMLMFAVAMALAIGVPAYFFFKHRRSINGHFNRLAQSPMERLQSLYVDGKIDLFEFERRVAHLIAIEH
jgi:hypothetical protein